MEVTYKFSQSPYNRAQVETNWNRALPRHYCVILIPSAFVRLWQSIGSAAEPVILWAASHPGGFVMKRKWTSNGKSQHNSHCDDLWWNATSWMFYPSHRDHFRDQSVLWLTNDHSIFPHIRSEEESLGRVLSRRATVRLAYYSRLFATTLDDWRRHHLGNGILWAIRESEAQALIRWALKEGHKILIFSERLITTVYIAEGLRKLRSDLRIANTVKEDGGEYLHKDYQEIYELMVGFAPRSNPQGDGIVLEDKYDIFILCMVPALKMLCEQLTRPFTVPSREVGTVG